MTFSPALVCEAELSEPVAGITARPARGSAGRGLPDFPGELLTSGLRLPWPPTYLLGRAFG